MSWITRCPSCGTRFRVTDEQLQAGSGQVRCGICLAVFDAHRELAEPRAPAASAPAPGEPASEPLIPEFRLEPSGMDATAAPQPEAPAQTAAPLRNADGSGAEPGQLSFDDDLFAEDARPPDPAAKWWVAGSVLLALVLAGQAIYVYRGELAARYPVLKPALLRMCKPLGCIVAPPQRPGQIMIEASDLEVNDPARPSVIRLTATLRNHAAHDVGYPALDLVLTDLRDHTLARRIFLPGEYLEPGRDVIAGFPARAEMTIRIDIDTGRLDPAGFRLDLLRAPAP
jgi:predicted Zn finger-like uncharacterized protein